MEQFEVGPSFSAALTAAVREYKARNDDNFFHTPVRVPLQPLVNGTQELIVSNGISSGGIPNVDIEIKTPTLVASYGVSFRKHQESIWMSPTIEAKPNLSMGTMDGGFCCPPEMFFDDGLPFAERLDGQIIAAVATVYETPIQHEVLFPGKQGPTDRWTTYLVEQGYALKGEEAYPVFVKVYTPSVT